MAYSAGLTEMYYSAALTLILKVITLPWILNRLINRLGAQWDSEQLVNVPTTMLAGLLLVIFAFGLAQPISSMATTITRHTVGIALAVILLSFLMMITRRKAVTQVIGFLAMENGLFLAATSATYGMPMVIELGLLSTFWSAYSSSVSFSSRFGSNSTVSICVTWNRSRRTEWKF